VLKACKGDDHIMPRAQKTEEPRNIDASTQSPKTNPTINKVMEFLRLFMCETLVKRIVSMILIALNIPNERVTELTGLCDRSVRALKKTLDTGDIDNLFMVGGGGRKRKLIDVEEEIIEEINNNNYHSRQEIADMIQEKYEIKVSLPVIGRLLKKTASNA
jgi:transposase